MKKSKDSKTIHIFHTLKRNNYTQLDNETIRDKRLSWKAKGILCYMLSLPETWEVNLTAVAKFSTDGWHSFRSGVAELEKYGYVKHIKYTDEKGRLVHEWYAAEVPALFSGNQFSGNQNTGKPNTIRRKGNKTKSTLFKTTSSLKCVRRTGVRQPHFPVNRKMTFSELMGIKLRKELKLKRGKYFVNSESYTKRIERLLKDGETDEDIVAVFKWYVENQNKSFCPQIYKVDHVWERFERIKRQRYLYAVEAGEADEDDGEPIVARRNVRREIEVKDDQ